MRWAWLPLAQMPELPEVQTVVAGLGQRLPSRSIVSVELLRPDMVRYPGKNQFIAGLKGLVIAYVGRYGKYIEIAGREQRVMSAAPSRPQASLFVHLGMSGKLLWAVPKGPAALEKHTHLKVTLDDGATLSFVDPRRFGMLALGSREELLEGAVLPRLGPDPVVSPPSAGELWADLLQRRRPVKLYLLDQTRIAGIGNIYADEICFDARISPFRLCATIRRKECVRLAAAIPRVILAAVAAGGTTFRDYRDAVGNRGQFGQQLAVYGRAGEPCVDCGLPLSFGRLGGRGTTFCGKCQR